MTLSDSLLLGMVAILAINYAATRLPGWNQRPTMFWGHKSKFGHEQLYFLLYKIPDFSANLDVVDHMISLLFFYHVVRKQHKDSKEISTKGTQAIIDEERRIMEENIRQYEKIQDTEN